MKTASLTRLLILLATGTVLFVGCFIPTGPEDAPTDTEEASSSYSIGDRGPGGGWIFYVDTEDEFDWTYLEAAPSDASESVVWSNVANYFGLGVLSGAIGRGESNTELIVEQDGHEESAAQVALDYEAGGFSDWFLPSNEELLAMRDNLHQIGVGGFSDAGYWSSMEMGTSTPNSGRFVDFSSFTSSWSSIVKTESRRVRAARKF
ncbi:MAG: hypothetical protein ACOC2N_02615 [Spirochaetota bacterium]